LGHLVRGLSALFWALPLALLLSVRTALSEWLRPLGMLPPVLSMALLLYGVWLLGHFRKGERIWIRTVERARLLATVNLGLAPFIYWWNKMPAVPAFTMMVTVLSISGILFLFNLNQALRRLAAMLPDETLRMETRWFTSVNIGSLVFIVSAAATYQVLQRMPRLPLLLIRILQAIEPVHPVIFILLILLPLVLTMTLIWKIKEAILHSLFSPQQ
jgi:hypothetical protein